MTLKIALLQLSPMDHASGLAPPYGLEIISTALVDNGFHTKIFHPYFELEPEKAIRNFLKSYAPDLVGIGIRNFDNLAHYWSKHASSYNGIQSEDFSAEIIEIVKIIKEAVNCPMVLGGSAFSAAPKEWLNLLDLTYGIIGPGENSLIDIANKVDQLSSENIEQLDISDVPGSITKYSNQDFFENLRIAKIGMKELLPSRSKAQFIWPSSEQVPVRVFTGCSHKCTFCIERSKTIQLRPIESLLNEIEDVVDRGFSKIFLACSELNVPGTSFVTDLCNAIIDRKLNKGIQYSAYINPIPTTVAMLNSMSEANIDSPGSSFTVSHLDDSILKKMARGHRFDDIVELALKVRSSKFRQMNIGLILGHPGETWETLENCFSNLQKIAKILPTKLRVSYNLGVRIYPNTPLHKWFLKKERTWVIYGSKDKSLISPAVYCEPMEPKKLSVWLKNRIAGIDVEILNFNSHQNLENFSDKDSKSAVDLRLAKFYLDLKQYEKSDAFAQRASEFSEDIKIMAWALFLRLECAFHTEDYYILPSYIRQIHTLIEIDQKARASSAKVLNEIIQKAYQLEILAANCRGDLIPEVFKK